MENDKDFELVNKFLAGEMSAYNDIVKKYQKKIYWHARQMMGNHLDADEVTQEVLIVMYNKLSTFNFKSALYTWLYRIVSTRSLNQLRRNQVKRFFSIDDEANSFNLPDSSDILNNIENKQRIEKVIQALQKLPVKQREVFVFRNFDGLSYEEISEITGKSIGGLKANYFHAIKKVLELTNENN